MKYHTCITILLVSLLISANSTGEIKLDQDVIDFGTVNRGYILKKSVKITNNNDSDLSIKLIDFTIPNLKIGTSNSIPSKSSQDMFIELDTSSMNGEINGEVVIHTDDKNNPTLKLGITGNVQSRFVFEPREAIFLSAFRWEADKKQASINIKDKEGKPFKIKDVKTESDVFVPDFEHNEKDNYYKIYAKLNPNSSPGMSQNSLIIKAENETISLPVYTFLKEEVYINPPGINFGLIDKDEIIANRKLEDFLRQSVFVYKLKDENFRIELQTVPSYLSTSKTPSEGPGSVINIPKQGETAVFEIIVSPIIDKLEKGTFNYTLKVKTNDKDFPSLEIPVFGEVL